MGGGGVGCCGGKGAGREGKLKEAGGVDPMLRLARSPDKCRALQWHGFLKYCESDTTLARDYDSLPPWLHARVHQIIVIHFIASI